MSKIYDLVELLIELCIIRIDVHKISKTKIRERLINII